MDLGIEGRIALVTGGSRGIGRATAQALAREGAHVTLTYSSNEAAAQETVALIESAGGKATAKQLDSKDPAQCKDVVAEIAKEQGSLHILVNNAGIAVDGLLMRFGDDDLDKTFRTNVYGPFYLARAAARPMMKARWGRMVMLGSVVGEMGNVGQAAYAATKAALDGLAKSVARELASRGVTANVVAPGFIATDMTSELQEETKQAMLSAIPLGSMGSAEDVAQAVTFLASDAARYVTGHVFHVNGGMYM